MSDDRLKSKLGELARKRRGGKPPRRDEPTGNASHTPSRGDERGEVSAPDPTRGAERSDVAAPRRTRGAERNDGDAPRRTRGAERSDGAAPGDVRATHRGRVGPGGVPRGVGLERSARGSARGATGTPRRTGAPPGPGGPDPRDPSAREGTNTTPETRSLEADKGENGARTSTRSRHAAPETRSPEKAPTGVEAYLEGGEWHDELGGTVFVHERLRSQIERRRPDWARLGEPPEDEPGLIAVRAMGLERALFLDLETGGLSSSPVFLAGTMHWNGEDFVLRQYFARHYGEEPALLRAVGEQAARFETLVTFNGRSYDAPFLRARALVHGVPLTLPAHHLDLLHPARRRWRDELEDCRLQTLERHVCRRRRSGDIPSDEVPGLYHDYVRHGDPYRLVPVFHHNLLDVITMVEILRALCAPVRTPRVRRAARRPAAMGEGFAW
jgi:uncharacterized protein YprB with RNaseH-like and TPR domain